MDKILMMVMKSKISWMTIKIKQHHLIQNYKQKILHKVLKAVKEKMIKINKMIQWLSIIKNKIKYLIGFLIIQAKNGLILNLLAHIDNFMKMTPTCQIGHPLSKIQNGKDQSRSLKILNFSFYKKTKMANPSISISSMEYLGVTGSQLLFLLLVLNLHICKS